MADETYLAVRKAHRDLYVRHTFYLLAVVGAAVGFALTQTQGAVLACSQTPLGLAMVSWLLSFCSGLRHLDGVLVTLSMNAIEIEVRNGLQPTLPSSPNVIRVIKDEMNRYAKSAALSSKVQVWALLAGIVFYVVWHVLEMYLRQFSTS